MMQLHNRPPVHLWVYNHSYFGISDQIDFLVLALQQQGYPVSIGKRPSEECLNIVIENFSEPSRDTLVDFCTRHNKRVAVIMTEHLDFVNDKIFIHGDPLWNNNDYMHPSVQVARIQHLFECLPYICSFLILGDLPALVNMDKMLPGVPVRTISFPRLALVEPLSETEVFESDLLFTGVITDYRAKLLDRLQEQGFSVASPRRFVSHEQRDALNRSTRLVLNLPQRLEWRWLSLMRIIAALRVGRVTVSLGTADTSQIAACCPQIDLERPDWLEALRDYVKGAGVLYERMHAGYQAMAEQFALERPFPHDLFAYWQMTDRVSCSPLALNKG
ncbi:hypothetical protein [Pseudomonas gingeri]|uniref:Glycosyltransferase family 1 protein n=1 Tax=Pseudomonas gingeri TaxID=117681 RepID=A0A7Y7WVD3_9PSED|nr:hypothetical protein [Pseudomonas gingeri]NWB87267.1 hypothetical protein [Pseudomonas gingeri]